MAYDKYGIQLDRRLLNENIKLIKQELIHDLWFNLRFNGKIYTLIHILSCIKLKKSQNIKYPRSKKSTKFLDKNVLKSLMISFNFRIMPYKAESQASLLLIAQLLQKSNASVCRCRSISFLNVSNYWCSQVLGFPDISRASVKYSQIFII